MTDLRLVVLAGGAPTPAERQALLAAGRVLLAQEPPGVQDGGRPSPYASAWRRAGLVEALAPQGPRPPR